MDTGSLATAAGDLFEIVYFHRAGRNNATYYISLENGLLQVNVEVLFARSEQSIPLSAIDSLAWGRANLLFVNWREGDQFRQTQVMGSPENLGLLVEKLREEKSGLPVDESSRHVTERSLEKIILLTLLVAFGLPVAVFYAAVYFGYVPNPWAN
jgi:hypothetical protein